MLTRRRFAPTLMTLLSISACSGDGRALAPIQLAPLVTLGANGGDGAIATTPTVSARHPAGYRIVIPAASAIAAPPLLFLDDGRFVGTLVGDTAAGGAGGSPMFARLGAGDSTWVFDNSARVQIFNPAHQFVRSVALPHVAWDGAVLDDSRFLTTGDASAVIDLRAANGTLVRSFGLYADSAPRPGDTHRLLRGAGATFWTTTLVGPWKLEQWDTAGTRLRVLEPHADWLSLASDTAGSGTSLGQHPPPPRIVGGWTDAAGRLWILGEMADRQWQRGLGSHGSPTTGEVTVIDEDKYYDAIVEVRDPISGRLISSVRLDQHCSSIAEAGVLVHPRVTSAGWQRAELLCVIFRGVATG
jgi:hypothetical protein